jgi:putative membrane protein
MSHLRKASVLGAAVAVLCVAHAGGVSAEWADKPNPDQQALTKMYISNQAEIQMGQLAQERAQSDQVREYGQMLSSQHEKANQDVQSLAQQKDVQLSAAPGKDAEKEQKDLQGKLEKLQQAQAQDFDKQFLDTMVDSHGKTIDNLSKLEQDVTDPKIKQLIQQQLPVLQQHHDQAEQLKAQIG